MAAAAGAGRRGRARAAAPALAAALAAALALAATLAAPFAALGAPGAPLAGRAAAARPRARARGAAAGAAGGAAEAEAGAEGAGGAAAPEAEAEAPAPAPEAAAPGAALAPEAALEDERLLGAWRYAGGSYRVAREGGRVLFREAGLAGELRASGEWLVAELAPVGSIRLKLSAGGAELVSNFKTAEGGQWGEAVSAIREWSSLGAKAGTLVRDLGELRFEGKAGDGVEVVVDGRQRPVALRISPEAAAGGDLGRLVAEAHGRAAGESLDAMTEMLRRVYASHFGGLAAVPPQAPA